jgi:transposase
MRGRLILEPTPMPRRRAARRGYWTDLTEAQWAVIAPLVPDAEPGGRPRKASSRELVNAILYALRAGCSWRLLPADLPPWQTVYYYLQRWRREGVWARIHHLVLMTDRERAGREPSPTAAIIDSQSVRTADQRGVRGAMTRPRRSPVASATS